MFEEREVWVVGPARLPRTAADVVRALPALVEALTEAACVLVVEGVGMDGSLVEFLEAHAVEPEVEIEPLTDDPRAMEAHVPLTAEAAARLAWALTLAGADAAGQGVQVYTVGDETELLVQWPGFPDEAMLVTGRADEESLAAWAVPLKCAMERASLR